MTQTHKKCFCDVHDSCGSHADKPPREKFDERLKEECIGIGMNAYVDWSPAGEEEYNQQLTEAIKSFFHTEWNTMVEGVIAEIDTNLKNNSDYNKGMCDAQNIIRRHLLK
jgi:uncharacterized protein (DUF2164 family)